MKNDPYYPRLKAHVIETTGMVFYSDKDEELIRILDKRMTEVGITDCAVYLEALNNPASGKRERDELVAELTIGETYFFRHKEQFDALRNTILPDIIERNGDTRRIRIWSAGCSTGAEPYTLSMILKREFANQTAGWTVDVIGTDINKKFLAVATRGRFRNWALRTTPDEVKKECFKKSGDQWRIKPAFKAGVSFQYHNLVEDQFPSHLNNLFAFDLILCRNVTIYFKRDIIRKIIGQFRESLVEGGWLVVGHAEPDIETFRAFETVNAPGAVVYRKTDKPGRAEGFTEFVGIRQPQTTPAPVWSPPVLAPNKSHQAEAPPVPSAVAAEPTEVQAPHEADVSGLDEIRDLANRGMLEDAVRRCEKLLETDKLNPSIHLYLALVLEQMGNNADAEKSLRGAIYLDRGFVLPHYHLGLFLHKKGDHGGGARSLANALKLLSKMDDGYTFEDGDGISVAQLKELAEMHLEVIKAS